MCAPRRFLLAPAGGLILSDSSVVTLVLPAILRDLDASVNAVARMLICSTRRSPSSPSSPWRPRASRAAGRRCSRLAGAVCATCAACALAPSLDALIAVRAAQGLCGAVAVAVRAPAERAGLAHVLDAPLALESKTGRARAERTDQGDGRSAAAGHRGGLPRIDVSVGRRPAFAALPDDLEGELDRGATQAFSRSFLAAALLARCTRRARTCCARCSSASARPASPRTSSPKRSSGVDRAPREAELGGLEAGALRFGLRAGALVGILGLLLPA